VLVRDAETLAFTALLVSFFVRLASRAMLIDGGVAGAVEPRGITLEIASRLCFQSLSYAPYILPKLSPKVRHAVGIRK
jgi:hypothetical protein